MKVLILVIASLFIANCHAGRLLRVFNAAGCTSDPILVDWYEAGNDQSINIACTNTGVGYYFTSVYSSELNRTSIPADWARVAYRQSSCDDVILGQSDYTAVAPSHLGACVAFIENDFYLSIKISGCEDNTLTAQFWAVTAECVDAPYYQLQNVSSTCIAGDSVYGMAACPNGPFILDPAPVSTPIEAPVASPSASGPVTPSSPVAVPTSVSNPTAPSGNTPKVKTSNAGILSVGFLFIVFTLQIYALSQ